MLLFIINETIDIDLSTEFQYITCYSLSDNTDFNLVSEKRFNTSHVTLYRFLNPNKNKKKKCFNTSHVTLYPLLEKRALTVYLVSIHHMLLFISLYLLPCVLCCIVSIHHMLLFIPSFYRDFIHPHV